MTQISGNVFKTDNKSILIASFMVKMHMNVKLFRI